MRGLRDGKETLERLLWRTPQRGRPRKTSTYLALAENGGGGDVNGWPQDKPTTLSGKIKRTALFRRPRIVVLVLVLITLPVIISIIILVVRLSKGRLRRINAEQEQSGPSAGEIYREFPRLNGFYNGIKTLVPYSEWKPENVWEGELSRSAKLSGDLRSVEPRSPNLLPYSPYPLYTSSAYTKEFEKVEQCYLDARDTILPPDLMAYRGIPQGMTQPSFGSYEELDIRPDVCFDRFGRYGPYGFGYNTSQGGLGAGIIGERNGSEEVWKEQPQIDFRGINWGLAQKRCAQKNLHRFADKEDSKDGKRKIPRTAMILRAWTGYVWTPQAIMNMRALVSELNLKSGGEYEVFLLLHVKDESLPIWTSDAVYRQVLEENIPREFWDLTILWNVPLMSLYYPGPFENNIANMNGGPIHGVYRSAHFAMQWFSQNHPEFDYVWNWEMDMRYSGHYYELLTQVGAWAKKQPRKGLWERSAKYWIPRLHGDYRNFSKTVRDEILDAGIEPVWGPRRFPVEGHLPETQDVLPPHSWFADKNEWGVGEEADIITFNPMFDPTITDWVFRDDITGWLLDLPPPPRRIAIITASRLSKRLLTTMHDEVYKLKHSAFAEMFPPTIAFHHGFKAAYAPHPIYFDRDFPLDRLDQTFNYPKSAADSVFGSRGEANHAGSSFYYNSGFSGALWRRWLGQRERDEGGAREEKEGTGRMCLRGTLFHPIKFEDLPED